jgi:uncharacterized protein involved in outer membrane biogenesis
MPRLPSSAWLRRLTGLALAMLLLIGTACLALPWWIEGAGMRHASQVLGREVGVATVRFQPWRLGLVLEELRVAGVAAADPPLLTVARLDVSLSLRSLWHRSLVLDSVQIERPVLQLARVAEGHYDIDDLLQRFGRPAEPSDEEAGVGLALYNLRLAEGQVLLNDQPVGRRHVLDALQLELPFLSLLDAHVDVHVEPHLSGRLNGVVFGSTAQALPFKQTRSAELDITVTGFELAPYLAYWPKSLALLPQRGQLGAKLKVGFSQAPGNAPELKLRGQLSARDVVLALGSNKSWLVWQDLQLGLKDVQPLKKQVLLGDLIWTAPRLALQRDASGRVHVPELAAAPAKPAAPPSPWRFGLASVELRQAGLAWRDASVRPASELALGELGLKLGPLHWPLQDKTALTFSTQVQAGAAKPATLSGSGELSAEMLSLNAQWQDLALEGFQSYLQAQLPLALQGRLSGRMDLALAKPLAAGAEQRARLSVHDIKLDGFKAQQLLAGGKRQDLLSLAALKLDKASVDPAGHRLALGQLSVREPRLQLQRAADGTLAVMALHQPEAVTPSPTSVPWAVGLAGLAVDQGSLRWSDAAVQALTGAPGQPHVLVLEQVRLRAQQLGQASSPVQMSMQLGRPASGNRRGSGVAPAALGKLQWQGVLGLAPLSARGSLRVERLPLQLLDPYLDPALGLHLRRAEAGFRGTVAVSQGPQGLQAGGQGELLLADLRLLHAVVEPDGQRRSGEDLLSWQALNLAGLKLQLQPAQPLQLVIGEASLSDFYARLVINEQGRFNLGEVGPKGERGAAGSVSPALQLKIGQTRLAGGNVDFSDRFIRPNYSAKLSDLQGSLGTFASGRTEMAPLSLKGRVAGTGLLEISGQLNPAGAPLALDIRASASDIELAPLSPYAGKYAGYAIDRGKLSTRLHYRIDPGGELQADNQVILNQLTFGERIDSPEATKLPVLLAVALLKDRHGVIDVNLPVSGSLNDPQFSIGGLIFHVIGNLLGRALTSPFSLLAGGGTADLSQAEFLPGSNSLAGAAALNLDKLAKALEERPGLNLTLTGWVDPAAEQAALQALKVEQSLLAERRREQRRAQNAGGQAGGEAAAPAPLSAAERERLLRVVYRASALPNRPRNLLGLLKELPPAEMQAMLAASHALSEDALRQLALERAVAVRDLLIAKGVPNGRIFLASPKLHQQAQQGKTWTPHVELALAAP